MAVDMFLELKDIAGESQDKKYKDKIDVLAWSWGMSQSGTTHMGSGGGSGKASFQDLSLTKYVDASTPTLMQKLAKGEHITEGTLIVRKAGGKALEYIKLKIEEIIVTSVTTGGSGGEDRLTENITLNFQKFEFYYTPQKADGTGGTEKEFKYDIASNDAEA
jgi:type VI secretion system secreted protein Hcp